MINIYAPINLLGYGIHANNMVKALMDNGEEINLTPLGEVQNDPYFEPYWQKARDNALNFDAKAPSLFIFHDQFSHQACGNPLLSFSVFETTKLSELSKRMLMNGPTDVILTTTAAHKAILEENGISKQIEVVNEGVDDCIFNTVPPNKFINTGKFTFITVGKNEMRKNTDAAIMSFIKTMGDKEAALIAHTFNPFANKQKGHPFQNLACWVGFDPQQYGYRYIGWTGSSHHFSNDKSDIYFTPPIIQTAEMARLYHSADVGIAISRGEGWDLPLTEMLACGLPTIATNCLGHSEYLTNAPEIQKDLVIEPTGKELANDGLWFKGEQGDWDTFNLKAVSELITKTYEDKEKYGTKSEEISNYILDNYTWSKAAERVKEIIG